MLSTSRGIILRRIKDKEADEIIHFFTENGENEILRIHGIRATRSRNNLITEPGCIAEFVFYPGKENSYGSLKEGSLIERFDSVKSSYRGALFLSALLDLTYNVSRDESGQEIYDLLERTLKYVDENNLFYGEKNNIQALLLFNFFTIRLFSILGIMGSMEFCSSCGQKFSNTVFWNIPSMEFLCSKCDSRAEKEDFILLQTISSASVQKFGKFYTKAKIIQKNSPDFIESITRKIRFCLSSLTQEIPACEEFFKQNL